MAENLRCMGTPPYISSIVQREIILLPVCLYVQFIPSKIGSKFFPIQKGGKNENGRVAPPDSIPIHINSDLN